MTPRKLELVSTSNPDLRGNPIVRVYKAIWDTSKDSDGVQHHKVFILTCDSGRVQSVTMTED